MYNNLFIPPEEIVKFSLNDTKTWTKKQAIMYASWLEKEKDNRIKYFCSYLKIIIEDFHNQPGVESRLIKLQEVIFIEIFKKEEYYKKEIKNLSEIDITKELIEFTSAGYAIGC